MKILLPSLFMLLGLSLAERSHAQGIDRESLAGQDAAAALHISDNQPYNMKLGPVSLRADAGVTVNFNDNINVAHTGRESDVYFEPLTNLHLVWQVTDLNTLSFDVGIGYQAYLDHSENNGLVITPGNASQFQFNVFVGDFKINVHDVFSLQQDPLQVGQLSNTRQFVRFQNNAGIGVVWDMDNIVPSLNYDHQNYWVFENQYKYLNNATDSISPAVSIKLSQALSTGFESTFAETRYEQNIQNDSTTISAGPYVTAQVSDNLSLHAAAGGYISNYESGGLNGDRSNSATYYGNLGLSHQINDVLSETLSAGKQQLPGITSNFTDQLYANYTLNWRASSVLNVTGNLSWQNLDDSQALIRQTSQIYQAGLSFNYALNDQASLNLGYQYALKVADPSIYSYYQDLVTLGFHYQF